MVFELIWRRIGVGLLLLALWSLGVRAFLESPRLAVEVEMMSSAPGWAQLFADDGEGFRQALSARSAVAGSGRLETFRLTLDVGRQVHALRLDPLNGPGHLRIRAITVTFGGRPERFAGADLEQWKRSPELVTEKDVIEDGDLLLISQGRDPRLVLTGERSSWRTLPTGRELVWIALAIPFLLLCLGSGDPKFKGLHRGTLPREILAWATPVAFFLSLNLQALSSWWVHDDPCLIGSAMRHGIAAHFFNPEVWRSLSGSVLLPWTIFSLGTDATLFGLHPAPFYAHQLLSFCLLVTVAYIFLRTFTALSTATTCLAITLFVTSAPAFAVAEQLMNRHYLEGLILFLGALMLFLRSVDTGRLSLAMAGAGLYLLAVTAKEVFVPLVAVLPLIPPWTQWRRTLRSTLPFAIVALLYAPWRLYMLGWTNSLSGYVAKSDAAEPIDLLSLGAIVGLGRPWQLLVLALVLGAAGVHATWVDAGRRSPSRMGLFLVATAVMGLPLVPIVRELAPRHFLLPTLVAGALVARALEPLRKSRPALFAGLGLALLLFSLHALTESPIWRGHHASVERHRAEGEFVLESSRRGVLLTGLADPNYLKCFAEIRRDVLEEPGGPGFCGDVCWCAESMAGTPFWHAAGDRIVASDPPSGTCAEERSLSVDMSYDPATGRLGWRLGPHRTDQGSYQALLVTGELVTGEQPPNVSAPLPIASTGEAPYALREPFRWIIKFRSTEGWQTYSPILTFDPGQGPFTWERTSTSPPTSSRDAPPVQKPGR